MRKLLKEHYKHLLKEEFDYSSKVATVYHLTGHRTAQYDPNWETIRDKTKAEYEQEIDDKYSKKKNTRAASILHKVEKSAVAKQADQYKGSKGQAYYIAQQISSSLFDLGSYFQSGTGAMYGKGLYTCYKLNPKIAQTYGNVILRFDVDVSNFLIFNAEIAKGVYGEKFKLEDQFLQILKNKGFNLEGYYNQEVGLEMSQHADEALNDFIYYLTTVSQSENFLNSNYSADDIRTAGYAIEALRKFSILFGGGGLIKLRDIIDGIIFSGNHDGPVCIIYHPEKMKTYKLTGAGYFDEKGNPVIVSDIGELGGQRSFDLKDSFATASEADAESAFEAAKERENRWKNVLVDYNPESGNMLLTLASTINNILSPLYNELVLNGTEKIMDSRFSNSSEIDDYCNNMKKIYDFIQIGPSILAEPFIDFVEAFGPGIEIVSKDEFEKYCYLFKQYHTQSKMQGGYPPKLADFESNGLKCQASNEEEFNRLVEQQLSVIINKFDSILNENIANDLEAIGAFVAGDELGQINNKHISCREVNVLFDLKKDATVINSLLASVKPLASSIERSLKDLFAHPDLQETSAKGSLEQVLKRFWISTDGRIQPEKIAQSYSQYSDSLYMAADLFYTILGGFAGVQKDNSTGQLSSYKIDKEKCNPQFIVEEMYNKKDSYGLGESFFDIVTSMFKEGSKAMNIGTFLTKNIMLKEMHQEKLDNLRAGIEDVFLLDTLDKVLI